MKQKVFVGLISPDFPFCIRRGVVDLDTRLIECRAKRFAKKENIVIPDNVRPLPYSKGFQKGVMYLVNMKEGFAVNYGSTEGIIDPDVRAKIDLILRDRFWRFVGGRSLGLVETLIMFGAGYGFLRLLEIFLTNAFGGR